MDMVARVWGRYNKAMIAEMACFWFVFVGIFASVFAYPRNSQKHTESYCESCRHLNEPIARFCARCGSRL